MCVHIRQGVGSFPHWVSLLLWHSVSCYSHPLIIGLICFHMVLLTERDYYYSIGAPGRLSEHRPYYIPPFFTLTSLPDMDDWTRLVILCSEEHQACVCVLLRVIDSQSHGLDLQCQTHGWLWCDGQASSIHSVGGYCSGFSSSSCHAQTHTSSLPGRTGPAHSKGI